MLEHSFYLFRIIDRKSYLHSPESASLISPIMEDGVISVAADIVKHFHENPSFTIVSVSPEGFSTDAIWIGHKEANQVVRAVGWYALKVHIDSHVFGIKFWRPVDKYLSLSKRTRLQCEVVRVRRVLGPLFDAPWPEGI